ncbi:SGNH/GDSL hydrolase family protein [Paracholeplasma manati]|uniref:SGNH/GDSL hydrolase family protein n=1 Tax=Paracholeplasma manati TaxID=591373 RepID=UPI002407E0FA|nr:SGNH/GDSL hydrolase family protein [Paracholeplasma manati]MDG0888964.1 SGNH/GDSL hydrolase family protein [Paracholeplasma manati]
MLVNIWADKTIYNETVVLEDNGSEISGKLLFSPTEIISVRDYTLDKVYDPSEYEIRGNTIYRSSSSTLPYLTTEQLAGENLPDGYAFSTYQAKAPGTQILFTEGIGIVMHQIAVTYKHASTWAGITPAHQADALKRFTQKINAGEAVNVVLYGDSISTGANSSGVLGIKPYQDDFGTLFTNYIQSKYKATTSLINTSKGGMLSSWGKDNVDTLVNDFDPDLVIIGFGMNDGSLGVSPLAYKENIEFMIRSIQSRHPEADIIVMHTIYANPLSIQNQNQKSYLPELESLQSSYGIALLDMGSITEELYKTKKGVDILANNINHPSDFLVRIYAAGLIQVLEG